MHIGIIGAGAAGCFCAIQTKKRLPDAEVTVLEGGRKPLAKVAITGGGRCNFTNSFEGISSLSEAYPRGERLMKRALKIFSNNDVCQWFLSEGVDYVVQDDCCIFPASQDAMQIVGTLERLMRSLGVKLFCSHKVTEVNADGSSFSVICENGSIMHFDKLVVTTGGSPQSEGLKMLESLALDIIAPVPSLFTFNIMEKELCSMMGTVVEDASTSIPGTNFKAHGPLLITHWGMSGPAALKLSAHAARYLAEKNYCGAVAVNWLGAMGMEEVRALLQQYCALHPQKLVTSVWPQELNSKIWRFLVGRALGSEELRWNGLGKKGMNKLVETLCNDVYRMNGKSRFREEFVTCGGIALSNVNLNTLECKKHPGLHFAGEVLDVDAITGGFNLQAAWSMAYMVAEAL